jgi:uncharacterized protein (DUF58 family)
MVRPLFRIRGLRIIVEGPARVSVGGEARFRIGLANHGEQIQGSLRVRRPFLPWDGTWLGGDESIASLAVGEQAEVSAVGRFVARGRHHIDPFGVAALVPLGLAVGPVKESRGTRFTVVPRIARIEGLALPERPRHQQGGVALASRTGESLELIGLRPYREGDPPRDLHARSWARMGIPVVREYQQEYFARVGILLDPGDVSVNERSLEASISLVAGLIAHLDRGEWLIDLIVLGDSRESLTVGRNLGQLDHALDRLADVVPGSKFDSDEAMRCVDTSRERLSALLYVGCDWDAGRRDFVASLPERGLACRSFIVTEAGRGRAGGADNVVVPDSNRISPSLIEQAGIDGPGLSL